MAKKAKASTENGEALVCQNRKARHEYHIEETIEAGLELKGTEVKSLRLGKGSIQEAFARIKDGQVWLTQFNIPPYEQGNIWNVDPVRERRLLMHRREIDKLDVMLTQKGYTLVPLKVYFTRGRAKVLIGIARGKKLFDKRDDLRSRDQRRDMDRAIKHGRY